jgi:hypothetical protein
MRALTWFISDSSCNSNCSFNALNTQRDRSSPVPLLFNIAGNYLGNVMSSIFDRMDRINKIRAEVFG